MTEWEAVVAEGNGGACGWTRTSATTGQLTTNGFGAMSIGVLMPGREEGVEEGDVGGVDVVGVAGYDG